MNTPGQSHAAAIIPMAAAASPVATPAELGQSTLLAFTAGFVDTASFVALFGLFAAHVTGNFVLIGASLANQRPGIVGKLLAFPVFLLVVVLTRGFLLYCERRQRDAITPLLVSQIALLGAFLAVGLRATPVLDPDATLAMLAGMFGVAAMAVQNAASRTVFAGHAPSTVMTGNVTQVMMDLVELAAGVAAAGPRARLRKMIPGVLGFAAGAIAGGVGYVWFGFACLVAPMLALILVLLQHLTAGR